MRSEDNIYFFTNSVNFEMSMTAKCFLVLRKSKLLSRDTRFFGPWSEQALKATSFGEHWELQSKVGLTLVEPTFPLKARFIGINLRCNPSKSFLSVDGSKAFITLAFSKAALKSSMVAKSYFASFLCSLMA